MTPQARGTAVAIFSSAIYVGQTAGVAAGALVIDRSARCRCFSAPRRHCRCWRSGLRGNCERQPAGKMTRRLVDPHQTLTSGTFGTVPRRGGVVAAGTPPPGGFLRGEERRLALARRGSGSFSGRGFTGPSGYSKAELAVAGLVGDDDDADVAARLQAAEQHLVGQRLLDVLLDHPRHRPRAHQLVIAVGDQPFAWLRRSARW